MKAPVKKTRILQMLSADPHWFLITVLSDDGKKLYGAHRVIGWALVDDPNPAPLQYVTGLVCGTDALPALADDSLCTNEDIIMYYWSKAETTEEVAKEYWEKYQEIS